MQDSKGAVWAGVFFIDCTWHKEEKELPQLVAGRQCFLPHANQSEHMPSNFLLWPMSRRVFIAILKVYRKENAGIIFFSP